jgi:superfamily II DNA/RNA helicase
LANSGKEPEKKREVLRQLIRSAEGLKNAIIFCNRKREVAIVHRSLQRHGFNVAALHGDMDQTSRMAALDQFRRGEVTLLVASDVAARGLDIPEVSHVFNFDIPHHADDYVHRIGRTGRAGRLGSAITVISSADAKALAAIEKLIGQSIPWMNKPEQAPAETLPPLEQPVADRPARGGRRGKRHNATPARETAAAPAPAPRLGDQPRLPRQPSPAEQARVEELDVSHLPAFLLRPVRVKA